MGANNGNVSALESTFKAFTQTQTEQNNILMKITKIDDYIMNKLSIQAISIKQDVRALQKRTEAMDTQLGKIARVKLSYLQGLLESLSQTQLKN
jgi:hypothetical protein